MASFWVAVESPVMPQTKADPASQVLKQCLSANGETNSEMQNELEKSEYDRGVIFTINLLVSQKHHQHMLQKQQSGTRQIPLQDANSQQHHNMGNSLEQPGEIMPHNMVTSGPQVFEQCFLNKRKTICKELDELENSNSNYLVAYCEHIQMCSHQSNMPDSPCISIHETIPSSSFTLTKKDHIEQHMPEQCSNNLNVQRLYFPQLPNQISMGTFTAVSTSESKVSRTPDFVGQLSANLEVFLHDRSEELHNWKIGNVSSSPDSDNLVKEQCLELVLQDKVHTSEVTTPTSDVILTVDSVVAPAEESETNTCMPIQAVTDIQGLKLKLIRNNSIWSIADFPFPSTSLSTAESNVSRTPDFVGQLSATLLEVFLHGRSEEQHNWSISPSDWNISIGSFSPDSDNLVKEQCLELVLQDRGCTSEVTTPTSDVILTVDSAVAPAEASKTNTCMPIQAVTDIQGLKLKLIRENSHWGVADFSFQSTAVSTDQPQVPRISGKEVMQNTKMESAAQVFEQCLSDNEETNINMKNSLDKIELERGVLFTINLLASLRNRNQNKRNLCQPAENRSLHSYSTQDCPCRPGEPSGLLTQTENRVSQDHHQQMLQRQQLVTTQSPLQDPISQQQHSIRNALGLIASPMSPLCDNCASSKPSPTSLSLPSRIPWPLTMDSFEGTAAIPQTTEIDISIASEHCKRGTPEENNVIPPPECSKQGRLQKNNIIPPAISKVIEPTCDITLTVNSAVAPAEVSEMNMYLPTQTVTDIQGLKLKLIMQDAVWRVAEFTFPFQAYRAPDLVDKSQVPRTPDLVDKSQVPRTPDLVDRLREDLPEEIPCCSCPAPKEVAGPYYTHLGAARDVSGIRKLIEDRSGLVGSAIRIEKVCSAKKEGKGPLGCPIAKWVIRRSSTEEKVLIVCRLRPGHDCPTAVLILSIVLWDGVPEEEASQLYHFMAKNVATSGLETNRNCSLNKKRTCACQGVGGRAGVTYSFGCSWLYCWGTCKHAQRSTHVRKFQLQPGVQVVTVTKHHGLKPASDEQLHVLPRYVLDATDEFGHSRQHNPNVDILTNHNQIIRRRSQPVPSARKGQTSTPTITEFATDNANMFKDTQVGGVAIALSHGSVLFEVAKQEHHATTALKSPNRFKPTRISMVFYQHKGLNRKEHGKTQYEDKAVAWRKRKEPSEAQK